MRKAHIGNVVIGGGERVAVQTMYDCPIPHEAEALEALLARLGTLKRMGCDIIRFSYPRLEDHEPFSVLCRRSPLPVVADIHFDYKLALDAISCGAAKIRINPGNIGAKWKVGEVVKSAGDHDCAIRIGLNCGSLPRGGSDDRVACMVNSALDYLSWFESWGFENSVVSLKSSESDEAYEAAVAFSSQSDCPLHLGVTEAGGVISSVTRGTWVLGRLLSRGIGSTLRFSITGPIETEVQAGVELLRTLGLRKGGIRIVSCPRCGRCTFDTQLFLSKVENRLLSIDKNLSVAIMGCQVNGPGEARHSDIAITGLGNAVFLYEKGCLKRKVRREEAEEALFKAIEDYE